MLQSSSFSWSAERIRQSRRTPSMITSPRQITSATMKPISNWQSRLKASSIESLKSIQSTLSFTCLPPKAKATERLSNSTTAQTMTLHPSHSHRSHPLTNLRRLKMARIVASSASILKTWKDLPFTTKTKKLMATTWECSYCSLRVIFCMWIWTRQCQTSASIVT